MKNNAKSRSRVCAVTGALLLVLSLVAAAAAATYTAPKKLADYLYYMEYSDYAVDLTTGEEVKTGFACSAVRNGNFYG
ncbi:MAG: hypothetical protein IJU32_06025, partial [Pyramidobacter sp.]|nr:hypothetical protein [Pyramidobacter sp.]